MAAESERFSQIGIRVAKNVCRDPRHGQIRRSRLTVTADMGRRGEKPRASERRPRSSRQLGRWSDARHQKPIGHVGTVRVCGADG